MENLLTFEWINIRTVKQLLCCEYINDCSNNPMLHARLSKHVQTNRFYKSVLLYRCIFMTAVIRDEKKCFSEWWVTGEVNFMALKQGKRVNYISCYRKDFCHVQEITLHLWPVFQKPTLMVNMRQRYVCKYAILHTVCTWTNTYSSNHPDILQLDNKILFWIVTYLQELVSE